jgi:tetratricopeptide (TPR) repeat protein
MNREGMVRMRRIVGLFAGALLWLAGCAYATAAPAGAPTAAPVASAPTTQQAAMEDARMRVAGGDLNGALAMLSAFVVAHPQQIDAERLLGDLYYRHGDLEKASAVYVHILTYAPQDKETHNRLGSVYATENKVDEAIDEFNRSLPGTDSVPDLIALHIRKGDFEQYKRDHEDLVRNYPGDTEAMLELAQIYEGIDQPGLAIQYLNQVLDDQPHSLFALNYMGLSLMDEHDYNDAIKQFQLCILYDGYDYPCTTNLGGAYWNLSQFDNAGKVLAVAHKLAPERPEALVNLGNVADSTGDWKSAVSYYVQAMTVDPYAPDAYINLGVTYDEHGLYQLAQSALVKGLAVAPEDGRLHFVLGDTYQRMGNRADAEKQFEAAAGSDDIYPEYKALAKQQLATLEHNPSAPDQH